MTADSHMHLSDSWYLVQLKPNGFAKAWQNLKRQNFETFMPLRRITSRHAHSYKEALKPVFPGYLFVRFGAARSDWRKINSTLGVARLVSFHQSQPAPVPKELIAGLQIRCDENNCLQPPEDLEIGEQVRLLSGPFAGFVGEIESFIGEDRIRMLYEIMGQKSRIDISQKDLERL